MSTKTDYLKSTIITELIFLGYEMCKTKREEILFSTTPAQIRNQLAFLSAPPAPSLNCSPPMLIAPGSQGLWNQLQNCRNYRNGQIRLAKESFICCSFSLFPRHQHQIIIIPSITFFPFSSFFVVLSSPRFLYGSSGNGGGDGAFVVVVVVVVVVITESLAVTLVPFVVFFFPPFSSSLLSFSSPFFPHPTFNLHRIFLLPLLIGVQQILSHRCSFSKSN